MNGAELENYARQLYNATSDTAFFTQAEILSYITDAMFQMVSEGMVLMGTDSSTVSVDGTRAYAIPSDCMVIKRIEYSGQKIQPISFREDDAITITSTDTADTGTPLYYTLWDDQILLRPVPDADGEAIKFYYFKRPTAATAGDELSVPKEYHYDIANYVVHRMAIKDEDVHTSDRYLAQWMEARRRAIILERKKLTYDSYKGVQDDELLPATVIGIL